MDPDTLYKNIFFGGLYGVTFFMVYLSGRKVAPLLAVWYSVGSWVVLMGIMLIISGMVSGLLFIPTVIVSLFVFRHKADNSLQEFFSTHHMYKATTVPEQVSQLLGSHYYSCAEGTLTTQFDEKVDYNWWEGSTSSMVSSGKAYITTFTYYLAISFKPNVVSDEFKRVAHAKTDTSGFTFRQKVKRFFVLDTETPIRVTETQDGSFVIIWQTYHDVPHFTYYLNWLKANRLGNVPVENNPILPLPPEPATHPIIQSSRYQHEQALGQAPKTQLHSRY